MKAGRTLLPLLLPALAAGCSPASSGQADAGGREQAPAAALAEAPIPRAQPAPILPAIDPDVTRKRPLAAPAEETPRIALANHAMIPPIKPSVVNIPPPAYVPDLPPSDVAADPRPFPQEVTRYMVDRDGCDHFRGEEAYDMERRAFLQENISELCTGTDARLARLRERYAQDPAVMAALSNYDNRIEGNASD